LDASAVAVSPDGNSVYVATREGTIAHFAVTKPGGQLTFAGCLDDNGGGGCTATPYPPILDASAVAVSPDGNAVYVASYTGTIARFAVTRPGGQLTYADCLANTAQGGCLDLPAAPISGASGVAISTDGNSVYVASSASDSVAHFLVSKPGGQLTFGGCLANDDAQACGDLPGTPLDGANDLAISPDDTSLYVVSSISESIAHFFRALGEEPPPGPVTTPGAPPPAASPPAPPGGRRVFCQGKRATIVGTARNDTLRGTAKADVIAALAGDDVVLARGGADLVCGGAGDDTLGGGGGPDRLFGQGGDDTVRGGGGPDLLFGGPGGDTLAGGPQTDVCDGGAAPDQARACETTRQLRSARPATGRRR
jgi:sugar lactone lactonase YvrE